MGRRTAATGVSAPAGGCSHRGAPPILFLFLTKRECAAPGGREKIALTRSGAVALRARRGSAYRCKRRFRLAFGHAILFCEFVTAVPWRMVPTSSGCKDAFDQLLFYCLALRRSQYFRHQCSTGSSFRAFRFTRKGYAASVSGRAANGCAAATRCLGSRRGLVVEDDFAALGAAGGGDIRRRNKRAVLPAQMLCISGQVRRPGFPGLRQPIDPIVALQSAALHFRAAERTIQTNLLLFRYPQERDSGKPRVFPVLSPAAKEDSSIIFGRTCACRKFPDPSALGAVHQ